MTNSNEIPPMPPEIEAAYDIAFQFLEKKRRAYLLHLSSDTDIIAWSDEIRATLDTISDVRLIELTWYIRDRMQAIRDFYFPHEVVSLNKKP